MTNICLNMIVKNESTRIERCLASVAPHISACAILDTGSDDGTPQIIANFLKSYGIYRYLDCELFKDFSTTRNVALGMARSLECDYILLVDADMELVHGEQLHGLTAPCYQIIQRGSGLTYWNTRLVRRDLDCRYIGVTHEYLDTGVQPEKLHGLWFRDHMDGANRPGKGARDIALLEADLAAHPDNARSWFYLGQARKEAGLFASAADAYAKRIALGGWAEETWRSRLEMARCFRDMKNEPSFEHNAIRAYDERPWRAEPVYDLARFYRDKSSQQASLLFAERGQKIPKPADDVLFVEDFPYEWGFKEELSICGFYSPDPALRALGADCCEELALSREAPAHVREQAWRNLFSYTQPLSAAASSFQAKRLGFDPPDGYRPLNPSVCRVGNQMWLNIRTVNYLIGADGRYVMPSDGVVRTRNFLFQHIDGGGPDGWLNRCELALPRDLPPTIFDKCLGFEDVRLFPVGDQLWCSATTRQIDPEGWCEIVVSRIGHNGQMCDWRVMQPEGYRRAEKNWIPIADGAPPSFIYSCNPVRVVGDTGHTLFETAAPVAATEWGGSSQAIPFNMAWLDGINRMDAAGYLCLIHERQAYPDPMRGQRNYQRRFVWFDADMNMRRISRRFFFSDGEGEFVCGMCWHPDGKRLVISYGVLDREAWLATVDADEVREMLREVGHNPYANAADGDPFDLLNDPRTVLSVLQPEVAVVAAKPENLGDLFRKYGTDKDVNGYTPFYESLFGEKRDEIEAVLEIGIGTMDPTAPSSMVGYAQEGYRPGGSLRAWRDWFQNASIWGIDTQRDAMFYDEPRILTFRYDSTTPGLADGPTFAGKTFDIIIDDGDHSLNAQLKTLENCLPLLRPGGTYVIEDVVWNPSGSQVARFQHAISGRAWRLSGPRDNLLIIEGKPERLVPRFAAAIDPWLDANTNAVLKSEVDLQYAIDAVKHNGWQVHPDRTKNWDCYVALRHAMKHVSQTAPILDAGADRISTFLPTLEKLGYQTLIGINLLEQGEAQIGNILYSRANIEATGYPDNNFAFIACLSTIEHGVNVERFLKEAARILKPGGHLFLSTDYWREPIDTRIAGWRIFDGQGIVEMLNEAQKAGLAPTGPVRRLCEERVCHHKGDGWGGDYTFINLLFRKVA